jgi:hypothetical protein
MISHTLASRVPDLKLHAFVVNVDRPDLEVNTNGRDVRLAVLIVSKTQQECGLAHAYVPTKMRGKKEKDLKN